MNSYLCANQASCRYGKKLICKNISLSLEEKTITGICGPNGAGKSTLLRMLAGLINPSHGTIYFKGKDLRAMSPKERARNISYIPQKIPNALPITVWEFLQMSRYCHLRAKTTCAEEAKIIERALESVEGCHLRNLIISELSGGEQKKIFFASALAQESELILLDEPCAHLDPHQSSLVFDLLYQIKEAYGQNIIVVSHNVPALQSIADRIIGLSNGELRTDKQSNKFSPEQIRLLFCANQRSYSRLKQNI